MRYRLSETGQALVPYHEGPSKRRLRRARGHDVALSKRMWLDATVFLTNERGDIIGSAFLIRWIDPTLRTASGGIPFFDYVVTAHHVVRDVAKTFARLRIRSGEVEQVPVGPWFEHPTRPQETDVAVARLPVGHDVWPVLSSRMHTGRTEPPLYGLDVFYAGWLIDVPSMGERDVPMVRSGRLGAWDQPGVPYRPDWMGLDESPLMLRSHLIDCYGYYGFSGSPCFIQTEGPDEDGYMTQDTSLLGVFVGFFNADVNQVPVNAGIAIVAPAWDVQETLERKEFMEDRKHRTEDTGRSPGPQPRPATSASKKKPGPAAERLKSDGSVDELAKRVMDAGKPDEWDDED